MPHSITVLAMIMVLVIQSVRLQAQYTGSASVSQGRARTTVQNLYSCPKGRVTSLGVVTANDGTTWMMPAAVRFTDPTVPASSDLHNLCTGVVYSTSAQAVAALVPSKIVTIDEDGELVTCFIFADNYFEMAINGVLIGKDNVPYTQFNSSLLQFRVKRPFTIAIHAVDWEENLGLGTEQSGSPYHAGDGGLVAVFQNERGEILATTNGDWKSQTFYTSPIYDLTCPAEQGQLRTSERCATTDVIDGSNAYALHWPLPTNWMSRDFDDTMWPQASEFTNQAVGVDNKPAYTNFMDVFDNPTSDAKFIWSNNIILDNEVVLRFQVAGVTSVDDVRANSSLHLMAQPGLLNIQTSATEAWVDVSLMGLDGTTFCSSSGSQRVTTPTSMLSDGIYVVHARTEVQSAGWLVLLQEGECRAVINRGGND